MQKIHIGAEEIKRAVFSFGIGSCMACYFILLTRIRLLPLAEKMRKVYQDSRTAGMEITELETWIFFAGLAGFILCPYLLPCNRKTAVGLCILNFLLFLVFCGILTVVTGGKVTDMYVLILWVFCVYTVWCCMGIADAFLKYVKKGEC